MRGKVWQLVAAVSMLALALAGCVTEDDVAGRGDEATADGRDDVVVVAVLDWQINPYHWDYLAAHMPQHQDEDPANDIPLDQDPATWLPGFPSRSAFQSYDALNLSLTPDDPNAVPYDLYEQDEAEWAKMQQTTRDEVHYRYIPGTKVVGLITTSETSRVYANTSHGLGASSVSVGNIHGTCPSCLLVFVDIPGDAGEEWVRQQDWIDVSTHSYEASTTGVLRDNLRDCETDTQKAAVERGQQIFWAAGNGLANTFSIPQTTLINCEKGPDWTVTVGAVHPENHASYLGHGKPVHVASVGSAYPRAGGETVTAEATFSGTSNATPVTAGIYAEALSRLRQAAREDARMQRNGTILDAGPSCVDTVCTLETGAGAVTVHDLRRALFHAATPMEPFMQAVITELPSAGPRETETWTEGYGTYLGRLGDWDAEVQAVVDHTTGAATRDADADLDAWMTAWSYCVQQVWGTWDHGHWQEGETLPAPDPEWPQRSWMASDLCPATVKAAVGRV